MPTVKSRGEKASELEKAPHEHNWRWAELRSSQAESKTHLQISVRWGCEPRLARRGCDADMASSAPTASRCCWKSQRPAENGTLSPRLYPPRNCLLAEKGNHQGVHLSKTRPSVKIFPKVFYLESLWGKMPRIGDRRLQGSFFLQKLTIP